MATDEYIPVLKNKLKVLEREISTLRNKVSDLFKNITAKQEQMHHILELLAIEGYDPTTKEKIDAGDVHITDIAFNILNNDSSNDPLHYRDLANLIQSKGFYIPGKDPAANLLSQINRDDRFIRVSSGTYGLTKWRIKPIKSKSVNRRKK